MRNSLFALLLGLLSIMAFAGCSDTGCYTTNYAINLGAGSGGPGGNVRSVTINVNPSDSSAHGAVTSTQTTIPEVVSNPGTLTLTPPAPTPTTLMSNGAPVAGPNLKAVAPQTAQPGLTVVK